MKKPRVSGRAPPTDACNAAVDQLTTAFAAARAKASAARSARGEFLAAVRHEVRTPRNGVLGMLAALATGPSTQERSRNLAVARRSGDMLRHVVNSLIDVADGTPYPAGTPLAIDDCPARILVAEDIEVNRIVACAMIEAAGAVVETVNNGPAAVAMVTAGDFNAVLMDIQMPVMNGIDATRGPDNAWSRGTVPVIGVTAHALASKRPAVVAAK